MKKLESSFSSIYDIIVLLLFIINWRVLKKGKIVYILRERVISFLLIRTSIDRMKICIGDAADQLAIFSTVTINPSLF